MVIYLAFMFIVLNLAFVEERAGQVAIVFAKHKFKLKNGIIIFELFLLLLICVLRSNEVGFDTSVYHSYFKAFEHMDYKAYISSSYSSPGYYFLNRIIIFFGGDFKSFLWLYYIIAIILLGKSLKELSYNFSLSLMLFLSIGGMQLLLCLMRQCMAGIIIFYIYYLIKYQKYIQASVLFLIAISFHASAAIGLVVFITPFLKTRKQYIVYIMLIFFSTILMLITGADFLLKLYAEERGYSYQATNQGGFTFLFMLLVINMICLFAMYLLKHRKNDICVVDIHGIKSPFSMMNNTNDECRYMLIILFGFFLQIIAIRVSVFSRIVLYIISFYSIAIPKVAYNLKSINKMVYILSVSLVFISYYVYSLLADSYGIVPYTLS